MDNISKRFEGNKTIMVIAFLLIAGMTNVLVGQSTRFSKSYSNKYLSIQYPSGYKITDEEVGEDTYDFCCELDGNDISMTLISVMTGYEEVEKWEELRVLSLKGGVNAMREELEKNVTYRNLKCTTMKEVVKGKVSGYAFTFTATVYDVNVQGECFMGISKGLLLTVVSQAENASYMKELREIINGIKLK